MKGNLAFWKCLVIFLKEFAFLSLGIVKFGWEMLMEAFGIVLL